MKNTTTNSVHYIVVCKTGYLYVRPSGKAIFFSDFLSAMNFSLFLDRIALYTFLRDVACLDTNQLGVFTQFEWNLADTLVFVENFLLTMQANTIDKHVPAYVLAEAACIAFINNNT